jgi:hypothetical protein
MSWTPIHHFPQGSALDTQASFDSAFLAVCTELGLSPPADPDNIGMGAVRGPCGFIALATVIAMTQAPDHSAGEALVCNTEIMLIRIRNVIRTVLAERIRMVTALASPHLPIKDACPSLSAVPPEYMTEMLGQWEVASIVSDMAASGGVTVHFLRSVFAEDDPFFRAEANDPPCVHEYFSIAKDSRWGTEAKHFMQQGADLIPLHVWAALVSASAPAFSPAFVVDNLGHYFCACIDLRSFQAYVYDSIYHSSSEPLDDHVSDVVLALKAACRAGGS